MFFATVTKGEHLDIGPWRSRRPRRGSRDNGEIWALPDLGRGAWENIAVVDTKKTDTVADVSKLFGEKKGTLFLFDVQGHGIDDQEEFNPTSRLQDEDLKEGGQLLFLERD